MVEPVAEMLSPERLALANQFLKLYVFVLAGFVGYQVITRVPPLLHTPLMSATNAISGISLVGSLVAAGPEPQPVCARSWASSRSSAPRSTSSAASSSPTACCKMFKRRRTEAVRGDRQSSRDRDG